MNDKKNGCNFAVGFKKTALWIVTMYWNGGTVRDFTAEPVADEALERILSAAFKSRTNDRLRQFEFVVVRDPRADRPTRSPRGREYRGDSAIGARSGLRDDGRR